MIKPSLKSKPLEDISLMLQFDNHKWNYLCDCGEASLLTIAEVIKISAVFVSHTHIDHFSNFDFLLRHQLGIGRRVTICGPLGIAKNVQGKINGYNWNLIEEDTICYKIHEIVDKNTVKLYELKPPLWDLVQLADSRADSRGDSKSPRESTEFIYEDKDFTVAIEILDHGTPSIAYLFRERDTLKINMEGLRPGPWIKTLKTAFEQNNPEQELDIFGDKRKAKDFFHHLYQVKGNSLAYVMDHLASEENHEKIINFVNEVDTLYIESYYRNVDQEFALKNNHSTAQASGEVARKAGVGELHLVHHSRKYSSEVADLQEEGRAAFEGREPIFVEEPVTRFLSR